MSMRNFWNRRLHHPYSLFQTPVSYSLTPISSIMIHLTGIDISWAICGFLGIAPANNWLSKFKTMIWLLTLLLQVSFFEFETIRFHFHILNNSSKWSELKNFKVHHLSWRRNRICWVIEMHLKGYSFLDERKSLLTTILDQLIKSVKKLI